ncbi:putative multidrug resistance protein [Tasmannia lanceolata]|uniref:putative multidrug resistance protein n=1 Tax=Tasmannia lanceolata TaxID=3420 RepID=UPI0040631CD7
MEHHKGEEEEEKGDSMTKGEENDKLAKPNVPFWKIFAEADLKDMCLMALGTFGCVADGSSTPLIMFALSKMMNNYAVHSSFTIHDVNKDSLALIYLAIGVGLGAFLEGLCWARTAERQTSRLRKKYLRALLRQDAGFFDMQQDSSMTYQVVSSISTDTLTIQDALSEKVPNFLMNMATFFSSQMIALFLSWRLSVVTIPLLSLLIVPGIVYGKLLVDVGRRIQEAYAVAGGRAEQALSSIRTIFSYVGERQTEESFSAALEQSFQLGLKQGLMKGMAVGSIGIGFAVWAFQAWYGSILVTDKGARGGDVFNAGVCIVVGGLALGGALANLKYLTEATVAASLMFEMIERVPSINSDDQHGKIMEEVKGELEFKDVDFAYPSRPGSTILRKFNLKVMASQTVGLVGGSGSGKSTVISLIERFYDPLGGEILFDGIGIKTIQLKWLRHQIGLVSQEPILFGTSIKENIMFGKEGASTEEVVSAAKAADAHNFIIQLPKGYDTQVGQFGVQMSGGQKQRIAIARALLKDPRILLLDEATSALDSQSEKIVQDALDQASVGRTTIIVAHRLSTIRNADLIAVLQLGEVVESGSHDQLIQNKHGPYSKMVQPQQTSMNYDDPSLELKETESNDLTNSATTATNRSETSDKLSKNRPYDLDNQTDQHQEDSYSPPSLWSLLKMTAPEWKRTLCGCIAALCSGAIQPVHSFCMGAVLSAFFENNRDDIRSKTRLYCYVFLTYATLSFITNVIQHYNFGVVGEHLTKRVREKMLAKVLTFEIGWFDQENNTSGSICSRLATEASMVRSLICDRLSLAAQVFSAATLALILGLALAWRLAIVIIALQPLIIGSFYARGVLMKSMSKKVLKAQNKSSELASEGVVNHKTITAFCSQEKIMALFEDTLKGPRSESQKQSWYAGFGLFLSQFLTAANVGLIFWYGGKLLYHDRISYKHLFQTFFILVTTGRVIAEAGTMTSDLSKGIDAIKSVFVILERGSKIEPDDPDGIKPEKMNGYVEFVDVDFAYPSRPKQVIFTELCLKIDAGRTVALVGQSGSGKSTIIGLVERFYDPLKGSVKIDGVDIKMYNLRALRSHIALVSQEPTLFAGTIHENIVYGKKNATEAEIIEAAALANAHEFISCMKDGYMTYCGERGVQLSGGQKQRIALARAILKNPTILLLDEATSALDSQSESLIQEAMEKMMVGRTCIVVAHRLSTIQKSDSIAVIENGKIVEEGSHGELLAKGENGAYFSLVRLQQNDTLESPSKNHSTNYEANPNHKSKSLLCQNQGDAVLIKQNSVPTLK